MQRRNFITLSATGIAALSMKPTELAATLTTQSKVRLGGLVFEKYNSPEDGFYRNGEMIRDFFRKLGPQIKSCRAKDISPREDNYMPQLDEIVAGKGNLDYSVFLTELAKLQDVPLMMEHLNTADEYAQAAKYIRSVGKMVNVEL